MKKLIVVAAALCALSAHAATYYQDRFIPGGVCMVKFGEVNINAALIQEVTVGPQPWHKYMGFWDGYVGQPPYMSLRVTMVNRQHYELRSEQVPEGNLHSVKDAFLKHVKDTCTK